MENKHTLTPHYFIRAAILFGFAMLIVYLVKTDNILLYIAPRMVIYVKLSAIGLYAIAIYQLYLAIVSLQGKHAGCACSHPPTNSWFRNGIVYSLFAIPLLLGLLLPNTTMGSSLAAKKGMNLSSASSVKSNMNAGADNVQTTPGTGTGTQPSGTETKPQPSVTENNAAPSPPQVSEKKADKDAESKMMGPFKYDKFTEHFAKHALSLYKMDLIQIKEDLYMESLTTLDLYSDQFKGKKIELTGFVYREEDMKDNQFVVGRFSIQCCSADAAPFGVLVEYDRAKTFANDTWVKVTGTITKSTYNNTEIMAIKAQKIEKMEAPKNQYVYPNFEFGS